MDVTLAEVVAASRAVAATRSRTAKTQALADLFARCDPAEVGLVVSHLSGVLPQRRLGVGYRSLGSLPEPADRPGLTVVEVDAAFTRLAATAGAGSTASRKAELAGLMGRATADEQRFLVDLITGNLRQGALDGVVLAAVATAYAVPDAVVRRAAMLAGTTRRGGPARRRGRGRGARAGGARRGPAGAPDARRLGEDRGRGGRGRAVPAACSSTASSTASASRCTAASGEVTVYTRSLDEITERVPEVVEAVAALPGGDLVLDGEAIVLLDDGRPAPFQVTGARTASSADVAGLRERVPLTTFLFDLLHRDGVDLIDEPARVRHDALVDLAPHLVVPRLLTDDPVAAEQFFADLVAAGHEGVVVKAADSPYAAGRRGSGWVKVKPTHTLDLVVLAVEWGSGRRQGTLSNIHLGARDPDTGGFVMIGKTFKGMTDEMLRWQTERFTELAVDGTRGVGGRGAPRAGRRDRLRRPAALAALPRWGRPAVRPGAALPRRQGRRRGRHDRHGAGPRPGGLTCRVRRGPGHVDSTRRRRKARRTAASDARSRPTATCVALREAAS